jgi:hypothetical protein
VAGLAERRQPGAGLLHHAGATILAGSDADAAAAGIHDELEQLVAAGLSPADALASATLSAAALAGRGSACRAQSTARPAHTISESSTTTTASANGSALEPSIRTAPRKTWTWPCRADGAPATVAATIAPARAAA